MAKRGLLSKSCVVCAYRVIYNFSLLFFGVISHHHLTGMSLEKLAPADTSKILSVYLIATQALPTIESNISRSFPLNPQHASSSGPGHIDTPSFSRYRELWRWIERLLRRAIVIATRICSLNSTQEAVLWMLFSQYQTCSAHWPPTFRPAHRSIVTELFIRALVLRARLPGRPPPSFYTYFRPGTPDVQTTASVVARRAIQDYRDILNASTHFPKAGERNVKVEELTDLCIAVWETGGSKSGDAAWVMDVRFSPGLRRKLLTQVDPDPLVGDTPNFQRCPRVPTYDAHCRSLRGCGARDACIAALCPDCWQGKAYRKIYGIRRDLGHYTRVGLSYALPTFSHGRSNIG